MECKRCGKDCKKDGKQVNGTQKYRCKFCRLYQQENYAYFACKPSIQEQFPRMNRLGCGVRKMATFLRISINTLQKWVRKALSLEPNFAIEPGGVYDIDELQTFLVERKNKIWITYAWHTEEKRAIALHVGGRSANDLRDVIEQTLKAQPTRINTDNLATYSCLIPTYVHRKGKRKANHIEREHRNLRKDIANLIQETMCYAKSLKMLEARIRWYFWGSTNPYFFLKRRL